MTQFSSMVTAAENLFRYIFTSRNNVVYIIWGTTFHFVPGGGYAKSTA